MILPRGDVADLRASMRGQLLLTGDTLYPGRLYVSDDGAYQASVQRLVDFASSGSEIAWVLGTHMEMSMTPGQDYPMCADAHPNEHVLQLGYDVLLELNEAVQSLPLSYDVHDDFIVYPL